MSLLSKVAAAAGATTADVVRVLSHGGTTRADWAIAYAIETVTGRDAYEFMLLAGREQEIAAIWADSRDDTDPVAPTNPNATYDPEVTVYGENTSPEDANRVVPHHPGDHDPEPQTPREQVKSWVASVYSAVIDYTRSRTLAARLLRKTSAAGTVPVARQSLYQALANHRRTDLFGLHPEPADLAA